MCVYLVSEPGVYVYIQDIQFLMTKYKLFNSVNVRMKEWH